MRMHAPCSQHAVGTVAGCLLPVTPQWRSGSLLECLPPCAGAADVVNAQLLLSAQQSLREAFPCSVVPHSLATFTMLSKEPCQHEVCCTLDGP